MFILIILFFTYIFYIYRAYQTNIRIQTYYCFDNDLHLDNNTQHIPNIFKSYGLKPVKNYTKADILFTNKHDDFFKLESIRHFEKCKYIYGLRSVNLFASKSSLPMIVSPTILPKTWILENKSQKNDLLRNFSRDKPTKHLLLKSNVQRQTGLKMVQDINDVINHEKYVVCQEILKNPLLINERKIDIRIYVLIICDSFKASMYIFNNGFIYYTNNKYSSDDISTDTVISSGYIDRKIYNENPLTLQNLYQHIGNQNASTLRKNINHCFSNVLHSYYPHLKKNDIDDGVNRFIILGADISPDVSYDVKLLEMNKGPDLKAKDDRDKEVKEKLVHETLNVLKNPSISNLHFTKII